LAEALKQFYFFPAFDFVGEGQGLAAGIEGYEVLDLASLA